MADWSGSSGQRKRDREDCLYPNAPKTPGPKVYRVKAGTPATARRSSDKAGRFYKTTKDLEFDSPYRESGPVLTFFSGGWLLTVKRDLVSVERG